MPGTPIDKPFAMAELHSDPTPNALPLLYRFVQQLSDIAQAELIKGGRILGQLKVLEQSFDRWARRQLSNFCATVAVDAAVAARLGDTPSPSLTL